MNRITGIKKLQVQVTELEKKINEMSDEIWKIKNPPKFTKGDKVVRRHPAFYNPINLDDTTRSVYIIIESKFETGVRSISLSIMKYWSYRVIDDNYNEIQIDEEELELKKGEKNGKRRN